MLIYAYFYICIHLYIHTNLYICTYFLTCKNLFFFLHGGNTRVKTNSYFYTILVISQHILYTNYIYKF